MAPPAKSTIDLINEISKPSYMLRGPPRTVGQLQRGGGRYKMKGSGGKQILPNLYDLMRNSFGAA